MGNAQSHSGRQRWAILCGCAAACGVLQTNAAETVQDARSDSGPATSRGVLEEVLVTAQKRVESVHDVPASISVLGGERIEALKATQLMDFAAYVPGFQVDTGGTPGQTQLTLRGIAAAPQASPAVGTYIDDAPLGASSKDAYASSYGLDLMPYDIERIEVLRGPQGTLYGASTMGGLVKYALRSASTTEFEARAGLEGTTISGADDRGWGARTSINVPLIEGKLGVRGSYFRQHTPGYIDNGQTGRKDENDVRQEGGRVALLWEATPALSIKLSAMLQEIDAEGSATMTVWTDGLRPVDGDLTSRHIPDLPFEQKLEFYSASVNWDLTWADFTSATSYSHSDSDLVFDFTQPFGYLIPLLTGGAITQGQLPLPTSFDLDKITQELRLSSPSGGRVEWLLGAFYTDEDFHTFQDLKPLDLNGDLIAQLHPMGFFNEFPDYTERALFGDATYKFTERFDLTAGVRLARNEQSYRQVQGGLLFDFGDHTVHSSEDVFTYMVSSRLHLNEETMMYARVASSYRPGGPNTPFPGVPPTVDADTLVNYEVGVKSTWPDSHLTLEMAAFYIDWKDIQVNSTEPSSGVNYRANGSEAKSQGVELSASYSPIASLRLGLNGAYTDAKLTKNTDPASGLDWLSGDRLPLTARFSGSLTGDYEFPLGAVLTGRVGGGYRYVGSRFSAVESSVTAVELDSYDVIDLSAAVFTDRWTASLFAKNAANERAIVSTTSSSVNPQLNVSVLQPRVVGLSLDVRF